MDREQSVGDPDTTYLTVRFIETSILILRQETRNKDMDIKTRNKDVKKTFVQPRFVLHRCPTSLC